jgi:hypothetical protein
VLCKFVEVRREEKDMEVVGDRGAMGPLKMKSIEVLQMPLFLCVCDNCRGNEKPSKTGDREYHPTVITIC